MQSLTIKHLILCWPLLLGAVMPSAWSGGDPALGKAAFARCASCHQVGPSARGGFGPQLNGLIGRRAGSTPDFRYSDAMMSSGIVWTEDRLRAFLKAPGRIVPGNNMRFFGLGNERQIDDLLAYLRTFP
jgi:cytochrome c